ncbi:NADase-type glycan-binding domain-containing protein [Actinacidiphila acididurans]|uniref:NADase-type glycan-binding domain-containing protein n=1 Tax=Actinacidiphila acididurans TaxID=2784346 RepID=UPI0027DC4281|nr:hypothetical protein [Actinacidiphila acididurans]
MLDPERAPAELTTRLSWWRRLWQRLPRGRRIRVTEAGYRPAARIRRRPRVVWPVVLVLLAVGGFFARQQLGSLAGLVHDRAAAPAPLHPDSWRASSQAPGHPPHMAFDGFSNRYWAPAPSSRGGIGQYVEGGFHNSVLLEKILITPGCSTDDGTFLTQARPAVITVTLFRSDGSTTQRKISVEDKAGGQTFTVRASDTVRIRLTADSAYGTGRGHLLALAEVEFFGRR